MALILSGDSTYAEQANVDTKLGVSNFLHIQDQKSNGTIPQSFSGGSLNKRNLNTIVSNTINGSSLANDEISLPVGEYYIEAEGQADSVSYYHRLSIYNENTTGIIFSGVNEFCHPSYGASTVATTSGRVSFPSGGIISLRQYSSGSGRGGNNVTSGDSEVYADIKIWKVG